MLSPVEFLPSEAMKASDDNRPVYEISIFWLFLFFSKKKITKLIFHLYVNYNVTGAKNMVTSS